MKQMEHRTCGHYWSTFSTHEKEDTLRNKTNYKHTEQDDTEEQNENEEHDWNQWTRDTHENKQANKRNETEQLNTDTNGRDEHDEK